jgi:hypothetical protein
MRSIIASLSLATAGVVCLCPNDAAAQDASHPAPAHQSVLDNYLNIASGLKAKDFHPMQFRERRNLYLHSLINPLSYIQPALSAGLDQLNDKPEEWGQGATGYAKRLANITGQSLIRRTVEFGVSALLHEDTRYFASGQHGVWRRIGYSLVCSVAARHDNGRLYPSVSIVTAVAAGAGISRLWLPPSQSTLGDAAASFGYTMAGRAGTSVFKEFLPDILRPFTKKK